jgi:hypothetical protein
MKLVIFEKGRTDKDRRYSQVCLEDKLGQLKWIIAVRSGI